MTGAPIDRFLPEFDIAERHEITVRASPETTYAALRGLDMGRSAAIRGLFKLRGLPPSSLTLDGLERLRFIPLHDQPPEHLMLGLIGRFWTPTGDLKRFTPEQFASWSEPGFAKAVWSFSVTAGSGATSRLETETRVQCTDRKSRRRFKVYWILVGPFSKWIRREVLRLVRDSAEA